MKLLVWGFQMSCAGHQWHYGTINPSQTSHDAHKLATRLYSTKYLWKPLSLFAFMAPISMLQAVSVITCIRTIESTWRNSLTPLQHSTRKNKKVSKCGEYKKDSWGSILGGIAINVRYCFSAAFFFFFKQKTAYEIHRWLEFRRVLFRSPHFLYCPGSRCGSAPAFYTANFSLRQRPRFLYCPFLVAAADRKSVV